MGFYGRIYFYLIFSGYFIYRIGYFMFELDDTGIYLLFWNYFFYEVLTFYFYMFDLAISSAFRTISLIEGFLGL